MGYLFFLFVWILLLFCCCCCCCFKFCLCLFHIFRMTNGLLVVIAGCLMTGTLNSQTTPSALTFDEYSTRPGKIDLTATRSTDLMDDTTETEELDTSSTSPRTNDIVVTPSDADTNRTVAKQPPFVSPDYVDMVTIPIALTVGGVGNIITLVAMTTEPFSRMSWSVTLASLAVADTIVLLMSALNKNFVINLLGYDVRSIDDISCKIFHFVRRMCKINSSWCVVIVCVERFIVICFPLKAKVLCTRNNTIRVVVVVWLLGVVYCSTSIIPVGMSGSVCQQTLNLPQLKNRNQNYVIAGSVLLGIMPMTILLILTPIICITLLNYSRRRHDLATGQEDNKYKRASAMLVSIHVAYIVFVLPSIIYKNIQFAQRSQHINDPLVPVVGKVTKVMEELVNHAINFFLYTAFNPLFRKRLTLLFTRSVSASSSNARVGMNSHVQTLN